MKEIYAENKTEVIVSVIKVPDLGKHILKKEISGNFKVSEKK